MKSLWFITITLLLTLSACTACPYAEPPYKVYANPTDLETAQAAADVWNEASGVQMVLVLKQDMSVGRDEHFCDTATVEFTDHLRPRILGHTENNEDHCRRVLISVRSNMLTYQAIQVIAHEMGHAMGLSHETMDNSLMARYMSDHPVVTQLSLSTLDFLGRMPPTGMTR